MHRLIAIFLILGSFPLRAITNGTEAMPKSWFIKVGLCGGALIHEKIILTAAHCVDPQYPNLTVLSRFEIDPNSGEKVQRFLPRAKKIIHHPDYHPWKQSGVKLHDLALIIMESKIEGTFLRPRLKGNNISLIGYGKLEDGRYQKFPKKLENLMILPQKTNETFWENNLNLLESDDSEQDFLKSFILGNYLAIPVIDGKSACRGDSGSPLFDEEQGALIGIVSHGQNDCVNQPVFFATQVFPYLEWINEVKEVEL